MVDRERVVTDASIYQFRQSRIAIGEVEQYRQRLKAFNQAPSIFKLRMFLDVLEKETEDVRKYMIEKIHISLFVEWGYLGMFHPSARVDSAMYVLEKKKADNDSVFIKLNDLYETKRYGVLMDAFDSLLSEQTHSNLYFLNQTKGTGFFQTIFY